MTTTTTTSPRYLTDTQIASYHREGYLALPRFLDAERVEALRRVTEAFVERSRSVARTDAIFDLDPRHTAAAPVVRRIKNPADQDPLYFWLGFESPILDVVSELIGSSLRFHHSKLNLKGSLIGAPVEVHQDAAFYPHSNDDVLAVGLLLDDATAENGAMAVLPGSHRGPIHTHFDVKGRFVGCMRDEDIAKLDRRGAVLLDLPAGSIHIHHYRLIHWSAPNTSPGERRLLINSYAAADAVNLASDSTRSPLYGRLVRGTWPAVARRTAGDMPMPPDFSQGYNSIYEVQAEAAPRRCSRPAGAARTGVRRSVGRAAWPPRQPGRGSLAPHPPAGARSVGSRGVGDSLAPPRLKDVAARLATRHAQRTRVPRPAPRRRVDYTFGRFIFFYASACHPSTRSRPKRSPPQPDVGNGRRRAGRGRAGLSGAPCGEPCHTRSTGGGASESPTFRLPTDRAPGGGWGASEPRSHSTGEPRGATRETCTPPGPPGAGGGGRASLSRHPRPVPRPSSGG